MDLGDRQDRAQAGGIKKTNTRTARLPAASWGPLLAASDRWLPFAGGKQRSVRISEKSVVVQNPSLGSGDARPARQPGRKRETGAKARGALVSGFCWKQQTRSS